MFSFARGRPAADYLDARSKTVLQNQSQMIKTGATGLFELVWKHGDGTTVSTLVASRSMVDDKGTFKMSIDAVRGPEDCRTDENVRTGSFQSTLLQEILDAQEAERKRISRDLHDEVGQALTVLKLNVGLMTRSVPDELSRLRQDCADLISCIDHVLEHVRRLARELSPAILEDVGLGAALRALLHEFARGSELAVNAEIVGVDRIVPKRAEITVYRVIQEILKNIACHARASNVTVKGGIEGGRLAFLVEDDGMGFDSNRVSKEASRGLGLALIGERIRLLQGELDVDSEPGKGTRIRFVIPIDEVERR